MARCILHLGSEKTGTSSIQKYFGLHRQALLKEGIWYPRSFTNPAGHVHLRLSDAAADGSLATHGPVSEDFREELQAVRDAGVETALFSSEFFHSQLRDKGSLKRLHDFLGAFFDRVGLVYYASARTTCSPACIRRRCRGRGPRAAARSRSTRPRVIIISITKRSATCGRASSGARR